MEPKSIVEFLIHFEHPTDEQLGQVHIFFSNYYNLQSVYFESYLFKHVTLNQKRRLITKMHAVVYLHNLEMNKINYLRYSTVKLGKLTEISATFVWV